ncbi:MAG: hypothetical protein LBV00_09775 [Propionibacteriaceae bacterium]|jgi:hypothetical protein|nr:hypothetical protein [Propionibacteriaceae bacterium]
MEERERPTWTLGAKVNSPLAQFSQRRVQCSQHPAPVSASALSPDHCAMPTPGWIVPAQPVRETFVTG